MRFHTNPLSARQLQLMKKLGPFMVRHGFYLGGGTAIAIMLGHRRSVDLDWFSSEPIPDPEGLSRLLLEERVSHKVTSVDKGTLYLKVSNIRVSILEYRYPLLHHSIKWKDAGCHLASLDDLACMKLSAISSRAAKKDFIDLDVLMRKHKPLGKMLKLYEQKFEADITPVLYALNYFDDAEKQRMPRMIEKVSWSKIKANILSEVKKISI